MDRNLGHPGRPRGARIVRSDGAPRPRAGEASREHRPLQQREPPHRPVAGEYGEGPPEQSSGVGPRSAPEGGQRIDDRPGHADSYGAVAPQRYGSFGYGSSPGHPSAYVPDEGVESADERLRELICERLTEDPEIDPSGITVEVQQGCVRLAGSVPSRHVRHIVEECAENCGARRVTTELVVAGEPSSAPRGLRDCGEKNRRTAWEWPRCA
jgi:hypothetical protein